LATHRSAIPDRRDPQHGSVHKGLCLQEQQRSVGVARPLQVELAIEAPLRAHFAVIARSEAVDHQHDIPARGECCRPIAFAVASQAGQVRLQ
jgi:hypothetical protein